ncbi:MAG: 2-amino-4-hydroxy-6-hydroxymethyldihydropteridine diphosphokinase [Gammaproteobacteria bacterium]|nr:2-amino-4-hydroxy-6-hydroxymethyldihydropteridine diphosphokinase [Gammaproteobacteria bacterium]
MITSQSGYILGIGSNIEPYKNIALIITELVKKFKTIHLSRVAQIPPIGINSSRDFLNLVVFIETDLPEADLKQLCNQIETALGRDRNDPDRKMKDRPADLDILAATHFPEDATRPANSITDEYFLYPLLDELASFLTNGNNTVLQKGEKIEAGHLTFGQTATTINRDRSAGNERVI